MPLGGKILKHLGAGRKRPGLALLAALQAHTFKQDFTQLLGAANVERAAGEGMNFCFQRRHLLRKGAGHPPQMFSVDADARHLHISKDGHHGTFQPLIGGSDMVRGKFRT